jgi:hypothetical protein
MLASSRRVAQPPFHSGNSVVIASITNARARELLLARLLTSFFSLTLVGLGVMTILTGHYYGRTSKLGGAENSLDGPSATALGLGEVLFGLFPLAFWFQAKRPRIAWAAACLVAAAAAFFVSTRIHRV